jgi:hypothetical protein
VHYLCLLVYDVCYNRTSRFKNEVVKEYQDINRQMHRPWCNIGLNLKQCHAIKLIS